MKQEKAKKKDKEKKKMRRVDMETVALCALIAVIGAFGMVAGAAAFMGISFQECNAAALTGIGCTLGGVLWGSLLILNRHLVSKEG